MVEIIQSPGSAVVVVLLRAEHRCSLTKLVPGWQHSTERVKLPFAKANVQAPQCSSWQNGQVEKGINVCIQ